MSKYQTYKLTYLSDRLDRIIWDDLIDESFKVGHVMYWEIPLIEWR